MTEASTRLPGPGSGGRLNRVTPTVYPLFASPSLRNFPHTISIRPQRRPVSPLHPPRPIDGVVVYCHEFSSLENFRAPLRWSPPSAEFGFFSPEFRCPLNERERVRAV